MKITTLIENHPSDDNTKIGEHGLSIMIEDRLNKILFDTGQTEEFIANAKKMNIDLGNIDFVVLSHGHYDHTGGIMGLLDQTEYNKDIFVGKGFFNKKYKGLEDGSKRYNGIKFTEKELKSKAAKINEIDKNIYDITENIILITNFKKYNNYEDINQNFLVQKNGEIVVDNFSDEVCLGIKTEKGLVLVVGCSHIGIMNIIKSVEEYTQMHIIGIIGGTHLVKANPERIEKTIEGLKQLDLELLAVSHCTGDENIDRLKSEFKGKFILNISGNEIII